MMQPTRIFDDFNGFKDFKSYKNVAINMPGTSPKNDNDDRINVLEELAGGILAKLKKEAASKRKTTSAGSVTKKDKQYIKEVGLQSSSSEEEA